MLKLQQMTREDAIQICDWKYPDEYSIYDMPSYSIMETKGIALANPKSIKNYYTFYDGEILIGFINLLNEKDAIFLGIGVSPEECSNGYGYQILKQAIELAYSLHGNKLIYLEVRSWNKRAVRCYEKAGFEVVDTFKQETYAGQGEFYRMEYVKF